MTHTAPPWSSKYKLIKVFSNVDDSELAARTDSPVVFDRRGVVFWYDEFETITNKWDCGGTGTGNSQALSTNNAWRGDKSMCLVTGNATGNWAYMIKRFFPPSNSSIGVEFHANCVAGDAEIVNYNYVYDGTSQYIAGLKWDRSNDNVYWLDNVLAWQSIGSNFDTGVGAEWWIPLKLVFDWRTFKYVRIIAGDTEQSLTTQSLWTGASANTPRLTSWFWVKTQSNNSRTAYIDDVIFTQEEP